MKNFLFITFYFLAFTGYSQDYMEKIARQTCDCLNKMPDSLKSERVYMELGACMINASEPYKKQLKKDHNIVYNNIDKEAEALGKIIGIKMASVCPDALLRLSKLADDTQASSTVASKDKLVSIGKVTQIDREHFVVFSVFDNSGKSLKFYWLTSTESNIDLANKYKTLVESDVKITYFIKEFFDPKIGEYRNFNVIDKIDKVSR